MAGVLAMARARSAASFALGVAPPWRKHLVKPGATLREQGAPVRREGAPHFMVDHDCLVFRAQRTFHNPWSSVRTAGAWWEREFVLAGLAHSVCSYCSYLLDNS